MKPYFFNPQSSKPLLHLAHANGFAPETYVPAIRPLLPRFKIFSLRARPFWGTTPSSWLKNWSQLGDDLLEGLGKIQRKPIVGVGHSLGAVCSLYAAGKDPGLFSRLVLIDPTMLSPVLLWKARWMKWFGLEFRKGLIEGALRRKREWESKEAAFQYFKKKSIFRHWPEETIRAYSGSLTTVESGGKAVLNYSPEWEAQIYRTIPTEVWDWASKISCPTLVIRGELSNTFTVDSERAFRKANPAVSFAVVPGAGHLAAQERPFEIGKLLRDFLTD